MRTAALAPFLLAFLVAPMPSQTFDSACPRGVVRWETNGHVVEGYLLESPVAGQSIKVQQSGMAATQRELAWDTPSLECQVRKGDRGKAAVIGLGAGALAGAFLGFAEGDDTGWCFVLCSAGEKATAYGLTLGIIGAAVGAVAAPGSIWLPLHPASDARRVGLYVSAHGVGVQVRF